MAAGGPSGVQAAWDQVNALVAGFYRLLPNFVLGTLALLVFVGVAYAAASGTRRLMLRRGRENLGDVLSSFVFWGVMVFGMLVGLTVVIPSLKPSDLLSSLGLTSVAIGFAFKNVLENWLAGLLILFRQPFRRGDQIVVKGYEGTVVRIETRATLIRTYDNLLIIIPNSDVFTNATTVKTAFDKRRIEIDVVIGSSDDIEHAIAVLHDAILACPHVLPDPTPDVIPWSVEQRGLTLRLRWWIKPQRSEEVSSRGEVVEAVKEACAEAGIDLPYETSVILFHDQTEEADRDRTRQREGWPVGGRSLKERPSTPRRPALGTHADPEAVLPHRGENDAANVMRPHAAAAPLLQDAAGDAAHVPAAAPERKNV